MNAHVLPIIALTLLSIPASAQLTAGEVPDGQYAYNVLGDIALTANFTADSVMLEFDCDDAFDGWAILRRGFPAVDAPNSAELRFYGSGTEVCADMASGSQQRPQYYTHGQALECSGGFNWQPTDHLTLGDFGGFSAIGPSAVDSVYIAFRQGGVVGWIRLSFDLTGDSGITLNVHRILSICGGTNAITDHEQLEPVALFPNPGNGEPVRVRSADALRAIELLDATGRCVARYNGNVRAFPPPEVAGTYLVRALHADGQRSTVRWVRY